MGLFQKLRDGLAKTHNKLFTDIKRIVTGAPKLDEAALEELEAALIASDIGVEMAAKIIEDIRAAVKTDRALRDIDVFEIAKQEIISSLTQVKEIEGLESKDTGRQATGSNAARRDADATPTSARSIPPSLHHSITPPSVILLVGVNGTGKTTSAAKLAHHLKSQGHAVLLAACDTFRAAAIDQLKIWGERVGVDVVAGQYGADSAAVAFDALEAAINRKVDYLLIDTAGRLHTKKNLMEEMKKMQRVLQKRIADAPHEVLLVLDGSTGQNALNQAREFHNALGVTGLIVTKLDGTPKGGIVVAIARELSIPVKFIGVGEQLDDLQPFDAKTFAEALFAE
jgi:fused signal recognition particle receptor